jgi:hypothetical protein
MGQRHRFERARYVLQAELHGPHCIHSLHPVLLHEGDVDCLSKISKVGVQVFEQMLPHARWHDGLALVVPYVSERHLDAFMGIEYYRRLVDVIDFVQFACVPD